MCLPPKVASSMGGMGPVVLVTRVTNCLVIIDPTNLRTTQIEVNGGHLHVFGGALARGGAHCTGDQLPGPPGHYQRMHKSMHSCVGLAGACRLLAAFWGRIEWLTSKHTHTCAASLPNTPTSHIQTHFKRAGTRVLARALHLALLLPSAGGVHCAGH